MINLKIRETSFKKTENVILDDSFSSADEIAVTAKRSSVGLKSRQKYECNYGLILTDCSMPFIDGYDTSKHILNNLRAKAVPEESMPHIVAVTGHVEPEYQIKAFESGM